MSNSTKRSYHAIPTTNSPNAPPPTTHFSLESPPVTPIAVPVSKLDIPQFTTSTRQLSPSPDGERKPKNSSSIEWGGRGGAVPTIQLCQDVVSPNELHASKARKRGNPPTMGCTRVTTSLSLHPLLPPASPIPPTPNESTETLERLTHTLHSIHPRLVLWRSRRDINLFLFTIVFTICSFFLVCVSNAYSDRINRNVKMPPSKRERLKDPLMDVTHPYFERFGLPEHVSDFFVGMALVGIVLRCITMGRHAMTVARRCLAVINALFLFRVACILLTVLPNPLTTCESKPSEYGLLWDAISIFLMQHTSCGDVFFSGHTVFFTTMTLVWHTYAPTHRPTVFKTMSGLLSFIGVFSLVSSSYHYTIDTIIAVVLTLAAWNTFHWGVTLGSLRRTWWGRVLLVLDGQKGLLDEDFEEDEEEEYDLGFVMTERRADSGIVADHEEPV